MTSPQTPATPDLQAQAVAAVKRIADEYAHCYAFVGDETMPIKRAELHQAIEALATRPAEPAPVVEAAGEPTWYRGCITLTALQLRHALDFAAPDFDTDEEQRETQVSIAWAPDGATHTDEGDPDPAGYKVWMTDYPEEGSIPLDESPAGFPVKAAQPIPAAAPVAGEAIPRFPFAGYDPAQSPAPVAGAVDALRELVALKDLKERFQFNGEWMSKRNRDEYLARQPLAWATAHAALAQQQPAPAPVVQQQGAVAEILRGGTKTFGRACILARWLPGAESLPDGTHLLYAAPQAARLPLTADELSTLARQAHIDYCLDKAWSYELAFARAIEREHGIGPATQEVQS